MFKRQRRISDVVLYALLAVVLGTTKASIAGQEFGRLDTLADGMDVLSNVATRRGEPHRLFLLEQAAGRVHMVEDGRLLEEPFLDIGDRMVDEPEYEEGLLGLAFPPDFAREPRAYLTYIDRDRDLVLSEFRVDAEAEQAVASSERVLFRIGRSTRIHHCGHIAFGPQDGALYVCIGDDQDNLDVDTVSQDLDNWKGKLLRIPRDELAANGGDGPDTLEGLGAKVVAYGLRNPWRFAFDPHTGDLFIPDPGRYAFEEINYLAHGAARANFGWPFAEGNHCAGSQMMSGRPPSSMVATGTCEGMEISWPILEYVSDDSNCSVIGGEVYRGERHPQWDGVFVFSDICSGKIWALRHPKRDPELRLVLESDVTPHAIGKDGTGEIVVVDGGGAVHRLSFPDDYERGWRGVDEVMLDMMLTWRREGTGPAKRMLDRVLNTESWRLGTRLAGWYGTVADWFR